MLPPAGGSGPRYGSGNTTVPFSTTFALEMVREPSTVTALNVTVDPGATPCTGTVTELFAATCRRNVSLPLTVTYTFTACDSALLICTCGIGAADGVVGVGAVRTSTARLPQPAAANARANKITRTFMAN